MHDDLKSFSQGPSQKFHKNSIHFEQPQSLSKILKVRSKNMKCMIEWVKRSLTREKNWSWDRRTLGKEVWSEWERFGRWKDTKQSRETEEMRFEIAQSLYIEPLKSWQIKRCQTVSRLINLDRCIYQVAIQRCSQQKEARWIDELSSIYREDRNFLDESKSYWKAIEVAIKGSWRVR